MVTAQTATYENYYWQAAVIGVALLLVFALAWSGAWKSWAYSWILHSSISIAPGLGLFLVTYASEPILPDPLFVILVFLFLLALVMGSVLLWVQPRWYGPAWLKRKRDALDGRHPRARGKRAT